MTRRTACLSIAASIVWLSGCVQFVQPAPEIRDYDLSYAPSSFDRPPLDVVLSIPSFGVAATYDREAIIYRTTQTTLGKYFYHRWATNPGDMVSDLIARDFASAGTYRAVVHQRSVVAADYQLAGNIEVIEERAGESGCAAVLDVRFLLLARAGDRAEAVKAQPHLTLSEPCTCDDPPSLVAAMSKALAAGSTQLQRQVYEAIAADLAKHP